MKKNKVIIAAACLFFVVLIGGVVIFGRGLGRGRRSAEDRRTFVQTAVLNKRTVMNTLSITGTVESADSKTVTSSLKDITVKQVNVQVGDEVKAGDVICVFDASDLEESLAEAQTNLNISRKKAENEVESAKEALENTKTSAAVSKARADDTAAQANSAYSEAETKSNQAYKEYEKAEQKEAELREKKSSYKKMLQEAKEGLSSLKAALSQVQTEEERARVQAEIDEKNKEVESLKKKYEEAGKSHEEAGKKTEEKLAAYEAAKKEADNAKSSYKKAVWEKEDSERNSAESISGKQDNLENSQLNAVNSSSNEENQVEELKEQIESCTIKAPVDGIITCLSVEAGEVFSGGEVVTLQNNKSFIVSANVDEYDIADVEKGVLCFRQTNRFIVNHLYINSFFDRSADFRHSYCISSNKSLDFQVISIESDEFTTILSTNRSTAFWVRVFSLVISRSDSDSVFFCADSIAYSFSSSSLLSESSSLFADDIASFCLTNCSRLRFPVLYDS